MTCVLALGFRSRGVLKDLRDALNCGQYPPGSKLPSERALAGQFGVSRPTIRRAVARLVGEGRIRTRQGSGMVVCDPRLAAGRSATVSVMWEFAAGDQLRRCQEFLLRRGFMPCAFSVTERRYDPKVERLFLERVRTERHHALIAFCSPLPPTNANLLDALAADGTRVIHIEPFRLNRPDQEYVLMDYEAAGRLAGERLKAAGCGQFVYVRMDLSPFEMLMERGFRKAVSQSSVFLWPEHYRSDAPTGDAVASFLRSLPEGMGVFCRSPNIAEAFRAAAAREGVAGRIRLSAMSKDGPIPGCRYDLVAFDRLAPLEEAMAHVARPDSPVVRKTIAPTFIPAEDDPGDGPSAGLTPSMEL